MPGIIADSSSILLEDRQLAQHQAVLALIRQRLDNPDVKRFRWLDLGCGQGQLLVQAKNNLSQEARKKIHYLAFDGKEEYLKVCAGHASLQGFSSVASCHGLLNNMRALLGDAQDFDVISLLNTVHELNPHELPAIFSEAILRLSPTGILVVYDMQALERCELGAIPWSNTEMIEILYTLLPSLGITDYRPSVSKWLHSKIDAWMFEFHRGSTKAPPELWAAQFETAVRATDAKIEELLKRKLETCRVTLESMIEGGSGSQNEAEIKLRAVYDFFALHRITNGVPQ